MPNQEQTAILHITDILKDLKVVPGSVAHLGEYSTKFPGDQDFGKKDESKLKKEASKVLKSNIEELAEAQELLWAAHSCSILMILQGTDTAGKDGIIRHVFSGLNPQGCHVSDFKVPSASEYEHDFLWRYSKELPERGRIGIFNRSYYEDVMVVRVHPELLKQEHLPKKKGIELWSERYEDINAFERHLLRNRTIVLKFFLHISKEEQRDRFLARLEEKNKRWKISLADFEERKYWDEYQKAFEDCLSYTSTLWAPWYVIPADYKWLARSLVSHVLTETIGSLDLKYPKVSDEVTEKANKLINQLKNEK